MSYQNRVLFISPFFSPEKISTGKYNSYLVDALAAKDMEVTVLTSYPLYPDWVAEYTDVVPAKVKVVRGGLNVKYPKSQIVRRIVLELWFSIYVLRFLITKRKNFDCVVAIFPPVMFVYFTRIILPKKVKIIGIIHDFLGVMANAKPGKIRSIIAYVISKIERICFKQCTSLVCLSNSMAKALDIHYKIPKKSEVFYPFVSLSSGEKVKSVLNAIMPNDKLHVVYSGALGEKQKPYDLLNFFSRVSKDRGDIVCHFFSQGPLFEQVKAYASNNFIAGVEFHELVPEENLNELFERSTVHIIPQAVGTGDGAFPSKLPNLLANGVPVFSICDNESELSHIVKSIDYATAVNTWDVDTLTEELFDFVGRIDDTSRENNRKEYELKLQSKFSVNGLVDFILKQSS